MTIREFIKTNHSDFDRYRLRGNWNVCYNYSEGNLIILTKIQHGAIHKNEMKEVVEK